MSSHYVLEGDWGGQIYLTIPINQAPDTQRLHALLYIIDCLSWQGNEGDGTMLHALDIAKEREQARKEADEWLNWVESELRERGLLSEEDQAKIELARNNSINDSDQVIVSGGMGGGELTDGLWIHPRLVKKGLQPWIVSFLCGQSEPMTAKEISKRLFKRSKRGMPDNYLHNLRNHLLKRAKQANKMARIALS